MPQATTSPNPDDNASHLHSSPHPQLSHTEAPVDEIEDPSCCTNLAGCAQKFKTAFHLLDDTLVALEQALNIASEIFAKIAKTAVGAVFFIVSAIELQETRSDLKELKEELKKLEAEEKQRNESSSLKIQERRKFIQNQINICRWSLFLCTGALALSGILIGCTIAATSVAGIAYFPCVIMGAILVKQISEYYSLHAGLKEQNAIFNNASSSVIEKENAKKEIAELTNKQFYKRIEIVAQILIVTSFAAGAIALGVLSFGSVPLALMIAGASIGIIGKVHQLYKEHQAKKNLVASEEKDNVEFPHRKEVLPEIKFEEKLLKKSVNNSQFFNLPNLSKKSKSEPDLRTYKNSY